MIDKESKKVIIDAIEKVNKEFDKEKRYEKKYQNTLELLKAVENNVSGGEYSIIRKVIPTLKKEGISAITENPLKGKEITHRTYDILEQMEKQKKKDERLYDDLLETYKEFAKKGGYIQKENNIKDWEIFKLIGGKNLPLRNLKIHK